MGARAIKVNRLLAASKAGAPITCVYPGGTKEIGGAPWEIHGGVEGNVLAPMQDTADVLHWHGDTFDLP